MIKNFIIISCITILSFTVSCRTIDRLSLNYFNKRVERKQEKLYNKYSNVFAFKIAFMKYAEVWSYKNEDHVIVYTFNRGKRTKEKSINKGIKNEAISMVEILDKECVVLDAVYVEYKYQDKGKEFKGVISIDCQSVEKQKKIKEWMDSL